LLANVGFAGFAFFDAGSDSSSLDDFTEVLTAAFLLVSFRHSPSCCFCQLKKKQQKQQQTPHLRTPFRFFSVPESNKI
jgi:hypothetical protein